MHLAFPRRSEDAVSGTSGTHHGKHSFWDVEPQHELYRFTARNGLYRMDKSSTPSLQVSPAFPTASPMSSSDIANGFLGFFALFKNGQHEYFDPYMDLYNRLAC